MQEVIVFPSASAMTHSVIATTASIPHGSVEFSRLVVVETGPAVCGAGLWRYSSPSPARTPRSRLTITPGYGNVPVAAVAAEKMYAHVGAGAVVHLRLSDCLMTVAGCCMTMSQGSKSYGTGCCGGAPTKWRGDTYQSKAPYIDSRPLL